MTVQTADQASFNEVAIRTAALLHEVDSGFRERTAPIPREQLFRRDRVGLGVRLEYERMGEQPTSDSLQRRANELGATFEHLAPTIGSVIHGIDLRDLSDAGIAFVRAALLERKVVFFRDQHLDEDEQVAFGRRFGELDAFPFGRPGENPYILEIRHGARSPGTENGWHSDVTWMQRPSLGSIAQCIEQPPYGGDTLFADSHACFLGLGDALRDRVRHLDGVNDYRLFLQRGARSELPAEVVDRIKAEIPFGVTHPLARTHPETGKTAVYLNGAFLRHDSLLDRRTGEHLDPEESVAIVAELLAQHARPEYQCRFAWSPGSIAFWDNRAVQHYAACDYYPHVRILRRVTVSGDRPYYDHDAAIGAGEAVD